MNSWWTYFGLHHWKMNSYLKNVKMRIMNQSSETSSESSGSFDPVNSSTDNIFPYDARENDLFQRMSDDEIIYNKGWLQRIVMAPFWNIVEKTTMDIVSWIWDGFNSVDIIIYLAIFKIIRFSSTRATLEILTESSVIEIASQRSGLNSRITFC